MVRSFQGKAISTLVVSPLVLASLNPFYAIGHAIGIIGSLPQGKPRKSPIWADRLIYNSMVLRRSAQHLLDTNFFHARGLDTGNNFVTEVVSMGFWAILGRSTHKSQDHFQSMP